MGKKVKKKKVYVLMISRTYPAFHSLRGVPTYFGTKIMDLTKQHTLRGNYEKWKRIQQIVNDGKGIVSVRMWPFAPYQKNTSPVEITKLDRIHVQKAHIYPVRRSSFPGYKYSIFIDNGVQPLPHPVVFASRDGLTLADFSEWFKKPLEDLALIQFTDFKY